MKPAFLQLGFAASIAALSMAGPTACVDDDGGEPSTMTGPIEPVCPIPPAPADFTYPAGPYGSEVGDTFGLETGDFELNNCDREMVRFGDVLADAELVLFNVGAGWCEPCIEESERLEAELNARFCGRGLRVVQVLFEDEDGGAATPFFCGQWRDRFGMSFPVLADSLFETSVLFSGSVQAQTPLNILVDKSGTVVFKESGTAAADLPDRIEQLLPPAP